MAMMLTRLSIPPPSHCRSPTIEAAAGETEGIPTQLYLDAAVYGAPGRETEALWYDGGDEKRRSNQHTARAVCLYLPARSRWGILGEVPGLPGIDLARGQFGSCLLYTSPSPRDRQKSRM